MGPSLGVVVVVVVANLFLAALICFGIYNGGLPQIRGALSGVLGVRKITFGVGPPYFGKLPYHLSISKSFTPFWAMEPSS